MRLRLLTLLFFALLAPAAEAGTRWVVFGHGFGHGVGMSQYGAYGFAKQGKGYRAILRHYYRGTRVAKVAGPRVVRVLVDVSGGPVRFSAASSACGRNLDPGRSYSAHRAGRAVRLRGPSGRLLARCGGRLRAAGNRWLRIGGTAYRGALEVVPTRSDASSLNAVNAVPVDQYVKGVIPNELPASWPLAALRAQAVAARSYALTTQVDGNGFDLYPDTRSQVYEGVGTEAARTNRAVSLTRGEVVMHRGRIAQTFFSACSGGHTESIENVFYGSPVPYLVGVPDPYDGECPLHDWRLSFSAGEISAKLGGYLKGRLKRVVVTERGVSPRIVRARLHGTGGVTTVRGDRLAAALGAYDRWLRFVKVVDGGIVGGGSSQRPKPSGPAGGAPPG